LCLYAQRQLTRQKPCTWAFALIPISTAAAESPDVSACAAAPVAKVTAAVEGAAAGAATAAATDFAVRV
jgi:hypothetical protein